jgi:tetratricopeptide (TPR) repeat protein
MPPPVVDALDALDDWRRRLPEPLDRVPAVGYVAGLLSLLVVGFVAGVLLVLLVPRGRELPIVVPSAELADVDVPVIERASAEELEAARDAGAGELAELAEEYPRDPEVLVALARARRDAKNHGGAVEAVERALEVAPDTRENEHVAAVLWVTAQDAEAREATFSLLEGPMGTRGADILFDLATTRQVNRQVRDRAEEFVESPQFEQVASEAARIAAKLREARKCDEVHALLDEAAEHGDERALPYLRRFQNKRGCRVRRRRVDCWSCLRNDSKLIDAIRAVTDRMANEEDDATPPGADR